MKPVTFRVRTNLDEAAAVFEAAIGNLKDYNEPPAKGMATTWDLIYTAWLQTGAELVRSQGRSEGAPWGGYRSEERRYVAIKGKIIGRRVTDADQLQGFKRLRLIPSFIERGHPLGVGGDEKRDRTARTIKLGSKVPYAGNHEYGRGVAPRWAWIDGRGYAIPRRQNLAIGQNRRTAFEQAAIASAAMWGPVLRRNLEDLKGVKTRGGGQL